jgi:hypothetical protein
MAGWRSDSNRIGSTYRQSLPPLPPLWHSEDCVFLTPCSEDCVFLTPCSEDCVFLTPCSEDCVFLTPCSEDCVFLTPCSENAVSIFPSPHRFLLMRASPDWDKSRKGNTSPSGCAGAGKGPYTRPKGRYDVRRIRQGSSSCRIPKR